jgi:hypothetical protein
MTPRPGNRINGRTPCVLAVECIKISGRKDVFSAKTVNYSREGLGLVSRKPVKTGTNLIVRLLDFPTPQTRADDERIRALGMAEVRWTKEVLDAEGLAYAMGVRYVYAD